MSNSEKPNNLQLLVDETYQLKANEHSFRKCRSRINTIHLIRQDNGCYSIEFGGKVLEVPATWKLFKTNNIKELKAVKDIESSFEMIFNSYFEVEVELFLGFNDDGPYLILNENRKFQENAA